MTTVIEEIGNPFLEDGNELLVIDTKDVMDVVVAQSVMNITAIGEGQYNTFAEERLESCTKPVTEPIQNKLPLFSCPPPKIKSKQKTQIAAQKNDCGLFSCLYISCQTRDRDLD